MERDWRDGLTFILCFVGNILGSTLVGSRNPQYYGAKVREFRFRSLCAWVEICSLLYVRPVSNPET